MTNRQSRGSSLADYEVDVDDSYEEAHIEWSNLIFLPFHPTFKLFVLSCVIVKTCLGPIQAVYPIVYCWHSMDNNEFLYFIKIYYWYFCDMIYVIDTFLHIVHRQVTDKALRREFLPKSGLLLLADIVAIIPFYRLIANDDCPEMKIWPNILSFTEFIIIYRVSSYYSLLTTHSFWNLMIGFTMMLIITLNCINCFWLLLTFHGLCKNCKGNNYDWRNNVLYKINETEYSTYVYGMVFIVSYTVNRHIDDSRPVALSEFLSIMIFSVMGYVLLICILLPKVFAESVLRLRRIYAGYPHVKRLVEETQRRNPLSISYKNVEDFYKAIWKKRSGITVIPEVIAELPRYMRIEIKKDLNWPLFYHSPILRKTGDTFQRWLCEYITQEFKLPGQKFFAGPQSQTHLCYLKTGVVQILSGDEGITPILSLTSGTIFGDISFLVPPLKRKVIIKCLTYCEIMFLSRHDYIKGLHKYPETRKLVLKLANDRLQHAKTLYNCKQLVRGVDRAEDEGIFWVKRRWWEISEALTQWKKKSKKDQKRFELPPEDAVYHCAKYIGQLVLCTDAQLLTKSLFASISFPWLLLPNSTFHLAWRKIVLVTVALVLFIYPPNITRKQVPYWFMVFRVWTDLVYIMDVCISLLTVPTQQENATVNFASVMFARVKTLTFNLDVLACLWIECLTYLFAKPEYYWVVQFNRLIKIYILFFGRYNQWDVRKNPMVNVLIRVGLSQFSYMYIAAYVVYVLDQFSEPKAITTGYFYGGDCVETETEHCDAANVHVLGVAISWAMECMFYSEHLPLTIKDTLIEFVQCLFAYLMGIYCKATFISALYLRYRETANFQNFVLNLKRYYRYYKIHHDLMRRLNRYVVCHWKYYEGSDIMHPSVLKNEPYEMYWKVQGEVAERIIGESNAFVGADPALIRDLAFAAKFLILPKSSTLFLFGVQCKNVTWIVQGHVKCEYHSDDGEILKVFYDSGYMLSVSSVFLGKASLRTYTACTDVEILYIKIEDFFKIIKQYPNEWSHLDRCISEFAPIFDEMFLSYVKKHRDYQNRLRDRIFHARRSTMAAKKLFAEHLENLEKPAMPIEYDYWTEPESDVVQYWLIFRMLVAIVSITVSSIQGGSGAIIRRSLILVGSFCDCVAWIDMILKLFVSMFTYLAYYDKRGVLVFDKQSSVLHYLTRGFILDLIGAVQWYELIRALMSSHINEHEALMINTVGKTAHLYIITGYFDYISDSPTVNGAYIVIIKFQIILVLVMLVASQYLMSYCVSFEFNQHGDMVDALLQNSCWLPNIFHLDPHLTGQQLHLIYLESLNLVQGGFIGMNFGSFRLNFRNIGVAVVFIVLMFSFWFVTCISLTVLVLNSRGNTLFQHGVGQLKNFLTEERVNKDTTEKAVAHFTYWWERTKGINIQHLTNERIGVVFRQDLSYYFFKKTFLSLDTLLQGGENLGRQLASASKQIYILPNEEIVREMDLTSSVYVVHKGKIVISKDGEKVVVLGMGSLFGQLTGTSPRPVRISAMADDYADLLQINIQNFQDIIGDDIRDIIHNNPQSKMDYIATKKHFTENPYETIRYILRGRKTLKLPWMRKPMESRQGNWYSRWLYVAWLIEPFCSSFIVILLKTLEKRYLFVRCLWVLGLFDLITLANLVFEFFTVELVVVERKCVHRIMGYRKLKQFSFYVDVVSLMLPYFSFMFYDDVSFLHQFRLLRLRQLYNFHTHFCKSFKSKLPPVLLKVTVLLLIFHAMSCGWILSSCRSGKFQFRVSPISEKTKSKIDDHEWVRAGGRDGGCYKALRNIDKVKTDDDYFAVVPKDWNNDYIIAVTYIVLTHIQTSVQTVILIFIQELYYHVVITFFIYNINIWLISAMISFVYTRFRELYQYDYNVNNLVTYLEHSGLSSVLLDNVKNYTSQLWKRQKGNWLPELAQQAPMCLREDLMCALYIHHLETPPLFRDLPHYFRRQLAARLKRIVIFPQKCIVKEGDIFPCMYFIHEGEVEKWYFDPKSGESRMMSLLNTNGYFGQLPGLFPNFAFQFTYYSRTVVDMVYLNLRDWQDLLDGYPTVKRNLYTLAKQLKKEFGHFGK